MNTSQNIDISINGLHPSTRQAICKKFNMRLSTGGDFKTFAAELNMSNDDITTISQGGNPTEEIFKWWEKKDNATVKKLLEILKKMERDDIIKIIRKDPCVQGREPDAISAKAPETSKDEVDSNASSISKSRVTSSHPKPSTHNSPSPPHVDVIKFEDMKPDDMDWDEANCSPIDVLLMVVNDNEFRAFYEILPEPKEADSGTKLGEVYFATIQENRVALVRSGMGAGGKGGVQATVMEAINLLNPKVIISAGVCFGMKDDKQELADVLVSKKLGTYAAVRVNDDGDDDHEGVIHECDPRLSKIFSNKMGWKGLSPQDKSLQKPNVHSGLILSGPQLIDNKNRKEYLKKKYPAAIGGEMEGEGLYNICEQFNVPWIVCKAICDWADGTKNKEWQLYAAAVAASFVKHVLTKSYVPERKRKSGADQVDSESPSPKRTKTTASKRTKTSASKRTKTTAS